MQGSGIVFHADGSASHSSLEWPLPCLFIGIFEEFVGAFSKPCDHITCPQLFCVLYSEVHHESFCSDHGRRVGSAEPHAKPPR